MSEGVITFGATQEEWDAFIALARDDVRPVVCDPRVEKSPFSVIDTPTKTPTVLNSNRQFTGMKGWNKKVPLDSELVNWRHEPAYGISLVGRTVKAIDIDIDSEPDALKVCATVEKIFGKKLPIRRREGQSRRLMLFKLADEETPLRKFVVSNKQIGAVEFLFDNQHFVVAGTHKTGKRHYWEDGLPAKVPKVTVAKLRELYNALLEDFVSEDGAALEAASTWQGETRESHQVDTSDQEYQAVLKSQYFREILPDGKVACYCPWQHLHTSTNGEPDVNPSAVVYFPKGLGGRNEAAFRCMHGSHGEKTIAHFREMLDYVPADFEVIATSDFGQVMPQFKGARKGAVPNTLDNLTVALSNAEWFGVDICTDEFTGMVQIKWDGKDETWRDFRDADYPNLTLQFIRKVGMTGVPRERLRDAVTWAADSNRRDSAQDWLNSLEWDGVPRVKYMASKVWGSLNTPYAEAVSEYMWTALAGRVLQPGIKADMVVVMISGEGCRKSSFVHALAPTGSNWDVNVAFNLKDEDIFRLLRGKVVAELPELQGINSRDEEHIKALITKQEDSWIPKYMEAQTTLKRRYIMIGTSNRVRFLPMGARNRRWLPIMIAQTKPYIDTDAIEQHRDQYWAEAAVMFREGGIKWERAERLAAQEMSKYRVIDPWRDSVSEFISENAAGEPISAMMLANTLLGFKKHTVNMAVQHRIEAILRSLEMYQDEESGLWYPQDLF